MKPQDRFFHSPWRFAGFLLLVSFAPVAFMLCIFRLLSFFIMPSLFFHLLFIGFPVGGFIGARYFAVTLRDFVRSLVMLYALMLVSVVFCLLCKRADYLRATMSDLNPMNLGLQIAAFTAMFLPFFCAYGLSEYLGYQIGRKHLPGKMRTVYAIYLFGAAVAYIAVHLLVTPVGLTRLMVASISLTLLASMLLSGWTLARMVQLVTLVCLLGWSGLDARFLDAYKGVYGADKFTSTKGLLAEGGWQQFHQRWGRYALVEMLESNENRVAGFYSDVYQWSYYRPFGIATARLDSLPFLLVPDGGRVLIIGSGGGRQVRWADEFFDFREIVAVEIEPEVIRVVRDEYPEKFNDVYGRPGVTVVNSEGRTYLSRDDSEFDLVFLPSVGGYPQMMLEPGNMIRTKEAYERMVDRLTPSGVLAVWYPAGLDPKAYLTKQYIDTFRSIGLHTNWYTNGAGILILASRDSAQSTLPDAALVPADGRVPTRRVNYSGDPEFTPITDEKPFLAGNVQHLLSVRVVIQMFAVLCGIMIVAGLVIAWLLRSVGSVGAGTIPYGWLVLASFLVGMNFLVMEHIFVIALFRRSFVYYDSLLLAAILFLVLTGVGSMLLGGKWRMVSYVVCLAACLALGLCGIWIPRGMDVAAVALAAVGLGAFFPTLFDAVEDRTLVVFAMDAVGAAVGSVCAFFLPILFGLSELMRFGAVIGVVTVFVMSIVMSKVNVSGTSNAT